MKDKWTERLSEYVDGTVADRTRAALERHLAECGECRGLVDELRAVQARASAVADRPPARDLWPGIAAAIAETGAPARATPLAVGRRRFALSIPQLAAAAIALMLASGGTVQLIHSWSPAGPAGPRSIPVSADAEAVPAAWDREYTRTVADLEHALARHRDQLDSSTVQVLEQNLAVIDRAIADAREALAADPSDEYVSGHLAGVLRQKVRLLQRAVTLAGAAG